jgi:hypothetical protein
MGWLDGLLEKFNNLYQDLTHDQRSLKIIFYTTVDFSIIALMVLIMTVSYAGSNIPWDLFNTENIYYSYAGSPTSVSVFTDDQYIGINGIGNSIANLTINGGSRIYLYPVNAINQSWPNGSLDQIGGKYIIQTYPGDVTNIKISINKEYDYDYTMHLKFMKPPSSSPVNENSCCFKVIKKGSQYKVSSDFSSPTRTLIGIKNNSMNNFPIRVKIDNKTTAGTGNALKSRILNYTGQIFVSTNDHIKIEMPMSEVSRFNTSSLKKVILQNTEGTLDVRQAEYKCSAADYINITPAHDTNFKLLNDQINVWGLAKTLEFRNRSFHRPVSVAIKEGNLAIISGVLMSLFTFYLTRLYSQFKK